MANTYYDSQLTAAEIEAALEAISGLIVPANNGKVLAISNGKFEARSVQWGGGAPTIEPLSVTENGTYTAPSGVDGYSPITVNVSGGGGSASLLTNSVSSDIAGEVFGRDIVGGLGGFALSNSTPIQNGIELGVNEYFSKTLSSEGNVTIYACMRQVTAPAYGTYPRYVFIGSATLNNALMFYGTNSGRLGYSNFSTDTLISESVQSKKNVFAISIDNDAKKARFFLNGEFIGEKSFSSINATILFGSNPVSTLRDFFYGGIVTGTESDATVIANSQNIINEFGIID